MEIKNDISVTLGYRAVAFAMALVTTALITTSTAVIFTGSTQQVGVGLMTVAAAPLRSLFGV